jgi:hypothetical protein
LGPGRHHQDFEHSPFEMSLDEARVFFFDFREAGGETGRFGQDVEAEGAVDGRSILVG